MTTIPRFFFCGDKTKLERFTENDYIYAFRVQVPVFVIAPCRKLMVPPTSKKIDALMAPSASKMICLMPGAFFVDTLEKVL